MGAFQTHGHEPGLMFPCRPREKEFDESTRGSWPSAGATIDRIFLRNKADLVMMASARLTASIHLLEGLSSRSVRMLGVEDANHDVKGSLDLAACQQGNWRNMRHAYLLDNGERMLLDRSQPRCSNLVSPCA